MSPRNDSANATSQASVGDVGTEHSPRPQSSLSSSSIGKGDFPSTQNTEDAEDDRSREGDAASSSSARVRAVLPWLVFADMLSVSLVVPLLHQYYRAAGVVDAAKRELLSSVFSTSQIVGGIALGALSDAGALSRKGTLSLSFAGSALSYGVVGLAASTSSWFGDARYRVGALVASRVLVGLVKQTATASTALTTEHASPDHRARELGRLKAFSTAAWIAGPSLGAVLHARVGPAAPAFFASALFAVNLAAATALLPGDDARDRTTTSISSLSEHRRRRRRRLSRFSSFSSNLRACFSSSALAAAVVSNVLFAWVDRATSTASMVAHHEILHGLPAGARGHLASWRQALAFLAQSVALTPALLAFGGERRAVVVATACLGAAALLEARASTATYLLVVAPLSVASRALADTSSRSLVAGAAPRGGLGSVLAALDVAHNAAAVTVPFYRTTLFASLRRRTTDDDDDGGDPDPTRWLLSSAAHWFAASVLVASLLLTRGDDEDDNENETKEKKTESRANDDDDETTKKKDAKKEN